MALAIAFDEAKTNQVRHEEDVKRGVIGRSLVTKFFDQREIHDYPHATMGQWDPGRVSKPHFHESDQFQVVIAGKGKLGRHELGPYCVHFSRAYTPYGPLCADANNPLTFFVMRAHRDPGTHRLPQEKENLKHIPGRMPWQVTRHVTFPEQRTLDSHGTLLQSIPGIKDEQGLAAYTLRMRPHTTVYAPDASLGDGQYLVVVKGSLLQHDKEHKAWALIFIRPNEGLFQIKAGAEGLDALVLNFPQTKERTADAPQVPSGSDFRRWQCSLCAFAYDEAQGLPEDGISPETRWENVPDDWSCPDCGASKSDFERVEVSATDSSGATAVLNSVDRAAP